MCNLASVNLSAFVVEEPGQAPTYDLQKLYEITKVGPLSTRVVEKMQSTQAVQQVLTENPSGFPL